MYIGIDIGGTKTLAATLSDDGVIVELQRFPTNHDYDQFLIDLATAVTSLQLVADEVYYCCVGIPGLLNREAGTVHALGNLPWHDKPIRDDISHVLGDRSVIIENDARLAGLSEAQLVLDYNKILFLTISTGIGGALIENRTIDVNLKNTEMGKMPLWHDGAYANWEEFAGGRAVVDRYHQMAFEITDPHIWDEIGLSIAQGLAPICAVLEPEAIILGGSVGAHADQFSHAIDGFLRQYLHPVIEQPKAILAAQRADNAVIYGCYDLAKQTLESK